MKDKPHGSVGSAPKGKGGPDTGSTLKHGSMGDKFAGNPPAAPNNPNAHASGKPKPYEGGPSTFRRSSSDKNYAENPKHLKQ